MITNFNTNFLLVWIFRLNCGQSGHGQSGQTRNLMREKVLKIVYINNIYYLYILSLGEKILSKIEFDHFDHDHFDHICIISKSLQCSATDIIRKIQGLRIPHIHSNLQHCFLSFFELLCLTSYPRF